MKLVTTLLTLLFSTSVLAAYPNDNDGNWPAWRGPTFNGHAASSANPPTEWSEEKNVAWKTATPGLGSSTPSVWGDKIILTTAVPTGRKIESPGRDANGNLRPEEYQELRVIAYDLNSGKEIWNTKLTEVVPHTVHHPTGSFAAASTVTDGKKVFAFFGSSGLFALDIDGTQLWKYELPKMKTINNFGEGASPVLHNDTLIVPWDEQGQSFVAGVDTGTGKEVWRTNRNTDSAWTTPVIVKDGDQTLAVVSGTGYTRAYDVKNGAEVWNCGGMSSNPTSSPVVDEDVVYVGNSFRGKIVQAIRFNGATGDLTNSPNLLWTHRRSASYVPSPVVVDDRLYFLSNSVGILNCVDAKTGEPMFPGKRIGLKKVHSSPIVAANRIYISSREGATVVVAPDQGCNVLSKNQLDDVFDASPVAVGKSLVLRGRKYLYHIR